MLGSVSLLSWNGNLAYGTILGTPVEVCYFGSNITNLEKCMKEFLEFVEIRIICWKERKKALGVSWDLRVINYFKQVMSMALIVQLAKNTE